MADKDKKLQDFMPYWKNEEKCYEDATIKGKDEKGKDVTTHWPRDEPMAQVYYKEWLKKVTDENGNYYSKRDKDGNIIKGTAPKHVVKQIVRVRRKDGSEYLYSNGRVTGFDALGDEVSEVCSNPTTWIKTGFATKRIMDTKTMMPKQQLIGPNSMETIYEMPFNAENLKSLFDKRISDDKVSFCLKDEKTNVVREVKDATGISTKTLELFSKDFDYLNNGDYISAAQKAELRQQAIDQGLLPPVQVQGTEKEAKPPTGTYG